MHLRDSHHVDLGQFGLRDEQTLVQLIDHTLRLLVALCNALLRAINEVLGSGDEVIHV